MSDSRTAADLELENEELRARVDEAEDVLRAIRLGEIDAVVVSDPQGNRVFTLEGADHPYRVLVESMNEGAATLTQDGVILYGNPRLAALLGISAAQLKGTSFADWVSPGDTAQLQQLMRTSRDDRASAELTLVTHSGKTLPVHVSLSSLVLEGQRFCCTIVTDLSLAKHHAALETAARHVSEANDRLREADQRKDEFLATLAHELRNPLAPISAAAHVIKLLRLQDDRLIHARDVIERQVTHLSRLVDDLLELSRITLGRIELQRRTENLGAILESVLDAVQPTMQNAQHDLQVKLPEEPLCIDADAVRLSQAISNVLENAAKYTPPGGRITLSAARDAQQVVIRIQDNGIGIACGMVPRIFEMFVQAEHSGQHGRGGLGIGLALSRRLVEMHGGTIDATSDGLGLGSEFTIRLPLVRTDPVIVHSSPLESTLPVVSQRVLVVDDNRDAAESLQLLLQLSGHVVRTEHNGTAALLAVPAFHPDVVLLDIGLPDLDGYEVARRLRARLGSQCPSIVALSGWGQAADKNRAIKAGFDAHFTKPVDPETLASLLAKRSTAAVSSRHMS